MPVFLLPLLRKALPFVAVLAAFVTTYMLGAQSQKTKYARKEAELERVWASKVADADAAAYARGLQAAKLEEKNKEKVDEIGENAANEAHADDLCLSADTVDRLLQLQ